MAVRLPPRVLAEVDEVGLQPVVRPLGGRLAQRARPGRLHLPAHVGLQRLEGHGLRHVKVALPRESVQLPRVPHVEVVGQVPQRLHLALLPGADQGSARTRRPEQALLPQKGACAGSSRTRRPAHTAAHASVSGRIAHPPEHAGEVRVVEGDHLGPVAPPVPVRFFHFAPAKSLEAKPSLRSPFMSGRLYCLASTESKSCWSSATSGCPTNS